MYVYFAGGFGGGGARGGRVAVAEQGVEKCGYVLPHCMSVVDQLTDAEANAMLAAMMNDDDDDLLPPMQQLRVETAIKPAAAAPDSPAAPAAPAPNLDDEALLRAAMDDNWDGASRQYAMPLDAVLSGGTPSIGTPSANSMGYLTLRDSALPSVMMPAGCPPMMSPLPQQQPAANAATGSISYSLPSLADDDEFMFPASGSFADAQLAATTSAGVQVAPVMNNDHFRSLMGLTSVASTSSSSVIQPQPQVRPERQPPPKHWPELVGYDGRMVFRAIQHDRPDVRVVVVTEDERSAEHERELSDQFELSNSAWEVSAIPLTDDEKRSVELVVLLFVRQCHGTRVIPWSACGKGDTVVTEVPFVMRRALG